MQTDAKTVTDKLPPLPEPALAQGKYGYRVAHEDYFTAEQMHAYALAAVMAERARWQKLLMDRAAGCERAAENTELDTYVAQARLLTSVAEQGLRQPAAPMEAT